MSPVEPSLQLLTPLPRVRGATGDLDLGDRSVELLAYLAVHRPDAVTGDRLRCRVLGNGEHDAAPKTLVNLLSVARRTLGTDRHGQVLVPAADSHGRYRLSPALPLDLDELYRRVAAGDRHPTDAGSGSGSGEALGHFVDALRLVEGEPLAAVRRGFAWWAVEGHEAFLGRAVVHAACRVIDLSLESNELDLARWAVTQGRLVEPDALALSSRALAVAGRSGDLDELRRVWLEAQRREAVQVGAPSDPVATHRGRAGSTIAFRRLVGALGSGQASLAAIEEALRSTVPSAPAAL